MAHNRKPTADKLKMHVHETFEHVRKALDLRERLLTRQIDVLVNTTPRPNARSNSGRPLPLIDQLKFMPQNETAVLENIRRLGKFNVDNYKFYADPTFAIEDYICPNADHELMYKCLQNGNDEANADDIELDFSAPTVPRDIEQQIVQLTVAESQELIAKARRPDSGGGQPQKAVTVERPELDNATDEQRIAKMLIDNLSNDQQHLSADPAVASTINTTAAASKSKKSKRRGKNNNNGGIVGCGGTINLKNISSLTINTMCSRENSVKKSSKAAATAAAASAPSTPSTTTAATSSAAPPAMVPPPKSHSDVIMDTHSTMENTSNAISDSHGTTDGPIDYGCEFYNRLIAEIKHTMKTTPTVSNAQGNRQMLSATTSPSTSSFSAATTPTSSIAPTSSSSSGTPALPSPSTAAIAHECSKMLFQNIRNLKITLPPASVAKINTRRSPGAAPDGKQAASSDQPVQIEEWLKQIISEPEVEPSPGADILEHSLIHEPVRAVE